MLFVMRSQYQKTQQVRSVHEEILLGSERSEMMDSPPLPLKVIHSTVKSKRILFILIASLWAAPVPGKEPPPLQIGERLEDFALKDPGGAVRTLKDYGDNALILVFFSVECPVSNQYNARLIRISENYQARGVRLLAVNANATEPLE
jgi:hypothetical protein